MRDLGLLGLEHGLKRTNLLGDRLFSQTHLVIIETLLSLLKAINGVLQKPNFRLFYLADLGHFCGLNRERFPAGLQIKHRRFGFLKFSARTLLRLRQLLLGRHQSRQLGLEIGNKRLIAGKAGAALGAFLFGLAKIISQGSRTLGLILNAFLNPCDFSTFIEKPLLDLG